MAARETPVSKKLSSQQQRSNKAAWTPQCSIIKADAIKLWFVHALLL